ncbi:hypothetical protein BDF14DRAFT_1878398 [Spinellus fusiger]|nr:hypothetical protein BDF14DRAFT_1878398 [Spinellus fusiger]
MSYSFPTEILKIIAQYLRTLDFIQCALTNKAWANSFAHILYTNVLIRTRRQFKLFYRTLQTNTQGQGFGCLVRSLTMKYTVGLTDKELDCIIECCPNLLSIDFNPKLWRNLHSPSRLNTLKHIERLPMLSEERHAGSLIEERGHQLIQLHLEGPMLSGWMKDRRLGSMLMFAHNLKRLDLTGKHSLSSSQMYSLPYLTLDAIDLIHSTCPHLEHLGLSTVFLESTELTKDMAISPVNTMRALHLTYTRHIHWKAIHYFIRKYPQLKEFSTTGFSVTYQNGRPADLDPQSNENIFIVMAQQWPCLYSFIMSGIPENVWPGSRFFDALQGSGVSLTTLKLNFDKTPRYSLDYLSHFMAMVDSSKNTLETLTFRAWGDADMTHLIRLLGQCQRLSSLTITGYSMDTVYALDVILEACPQLKSLSLTLGKLVLSNPYSKNTPEMHPLSELSIEFITLEMKAITHYLSLCCPHLSSLSISDVNIRQAFPDGRVEINMPDHTFDRIQIKSMYAIRLSPEDERMSTYAIKLLALSPLKRMNGTLRRRDCLEIDWHQHKEHELEKEQTLTRWYHYYKEKGIDYVKQLYRLPTKEASEASSYTITLDEWNQSFDMKTYEGKKQWRQNIFRGFISIRCQDVDYLCFEGTPL